MFGDDRIKQFDADIGKEGYKQAVKTNNEYLYVCFFLERIDQHVALNLLSHPEALVFFKTITQDPFRLNRQCPRSLREPPVSGPQKPVKKAPSFLRRRFKDNPYLFVYFKLSEFIN
jgi:hypothetical protein